MPETFGRTTGVSIRRATRRWSAMAAGATVAILAACIAAASTPADAGPVAEWPSYGNDPGGMRYSPLDQINRDNVKDLKVAWTYHTGDVSDGTQAKRKSSFENTPIVVDGTMYLSTPFNRVIALNPESGAEKWIYDPKLDLQNSYYSEGLINRGVSSWPDPARKPGDPCARRIFIATIDARLIALDAATGKTCADFGAQGQIDLKAGVANIDKLRYRGEYEETSPPAIIDDLVVVGSAIGDNGHVDEPSGVVRAFDARSGALRWSWDPMPRDPADPAAKTWTHSGPPNSGAANIWSIISVDREHDLVFLPGSSASPDYYGGERPGADIYSDSLVALHGATGKLAWYFQTTHHDLWDYDNPSMPLLCTIRHNGVDVPAVVQGTKRGSLFVFNRLTGEPLFPIVEKPAPQSDVPGEETSATQPFPTLPPPLIPLSISADDAWGVMYFDRRQCRNRMAALRNEGIFTPPSIAGSLIIPGNVGGMNWSSAAFDPARQLLVTNTNNLVADVHLIPRAEFTEQANASRGFETEFAPQAGTPYGMSRVFMRSSFPGLPCNPPPWGLLTAVDLSSGRIKWSVPLGNILRFYHLPLPDRGWGSPNLGGAIVTAGGLVFIAATLDPYLRAFDTDSGKLLWEAKLPAGGQATPMTYQVRSDGKQYLVIAAGGHGKLGTKLGDSVVAFTLP
jgi:quinoprotein glucose dehydrogenase